MFTLFYRKPTNDGITPYVTVFIELDDIEMLTVTAAALFHNGQAIGRDALIMQGEKVVSIITASQALALYDIISTAP